MRDRLTHLAGAILRLFIVGNLALGGLFLLGLLLSFPFEGALAARLVTKYGAAVDSGGVLNTLRVLAIVGIGSVVIVHHVLASMRAIVATVDAGDPFAMANADRLTRIGWGLLGLQLIHFAAGGFIVRLARLGIETATWTPQFGGWLGVLLAFVLARVFRRGAAMRDDLAMTV
jgi:Protein of unknown function (DUF2975)